MDATLHALGGILLRAIPTFLLVILLNFYLKFVFFRPFERVLQQRYDLTEGARKLAQESMERASAKASEYEAAIRAARSEVYKGQEKLYKEFQDQHAAAVTSAREGADAAVKKAKAELAQDVEAARSTLASDAESLAREIAQSVLRRNAA
jgi:F-type H+-transporting ATPase subunit b